MSKVCGCIFICMTPGTTTSDTRPLYSGVPVPWQVREESDVTGLVLVECLVIVEYCECNVYYVVDHNSSGC